MSGRSTASELRWFAPGSGPMLARSRPRQRTDRYHVDSLAPDRAVKSRGKRATLEMKVLVERGKPVEIAGYQWEPEHWRKTAKVDPGVIEQGIWVSVEKRIWRRPGIEVCHIGLAGTTWWSLAVKIRGGTPAPIHHKLVRHLSTAGDELLCCGYPEWLLLQLGKLPPTDASGTGGEVTSLTLPGRQPGDRQAAGGRSTPPSPGR